MNPYSPRIWQREPDLNIMPIAEVVRPDPILHGEDPTPRLTEIAETTDATIADLNDATIAVADLPPEETERFRAAVEWRAHR